jgi:tetratricopeptide (TPR) repeat protein
MPASTESQDETSIINSGPAPIVLIGPVDTLITDSDISNLSFAMAPLIRRDLFCVQGISVVPTADTNVPIKAYFLKKAGLARLAAAHGADIIAVGRLKGDAKKLMLEFEAHDVRDNRIVFKTSIAGKASRIYKMEKELVRRFVAALGISLSPIELEMIEKNAPRKTAAAISYGQGLKHIEREKFTEALISFQDAGKDDEAFALGHAALAKVFTRFNAPDKALLSLERAVTVDKYYAEAWYDLNIHLSVRRKRDDLALAYCHQALAISPNFGKARLSLGARLYSTGNLEEAIEQTKLAADLLPTDTIARYNLGVYHRELGDTQEARLWFKHALRINPGFEPARVDLMNLPTR